MQNRGRGVPGASPPIAPRYRKDFSMNAPSTVREKGDHFLLFGLPRKLWIEMSALEEFLFQRGGAGTFAEAQLGTQRRLSRPARSGCSRRILARARRNAQGRRAQAASAARTFGRSLRAE